MRLRILPYKRGSHSAKILSHKLGILRLKTQGSSFIPRLTDKIINWGCSSTELPTNLLINQPTSVARASDKVAAFRTMYLCGTVPFTVSKEIAKEWQEQGDTVVARTLTRAHSGRGIVICKPQHLLPDAPLYTKYIKKCHEFRVHVAFGEVIDVQRKMRCRDTPDDQVNWQIRNHTNGFIFGREEVELPDIALEQAVVAVEALELDFGAVDVIYNSHYDAYYVLEVNTAPGLTDTTATKYKEAFHARLFS